MNAWTLIYKIQHSTKTDKHTNKKNAIPNQHLPIMKIVIFKVKQPFGSKTKFRSQEYTSYRWLNAIGEWEVAMD